MQRSWKAALQIAFTYIGTVVGAGFASGKEIVEFFVQYGSQGLVGILLATGLLSGAESGSWCYPIGFRPILTRT